MTKLSKVLNIFVGIVIIILSICVFTYDANFYSVGYARITPPSSESDSFYGGDAYTGIQQAAAQAANNLIPVFEAVEENHSALRTVNDNIIKETNAVKFAIGSVLLSFGLFVTFKYLGALLESGGNKKDKSVIQNTNIPALNTPSLIPKSTSEPVYNVTPVETGVINSGNSEQ